MSDATITLERPPETEAEQRPAPLARDVSECPPHHFVVDSPSGSPVSAAFCRKCGVHREYRNWLEQYEYIGTGADWKKTAG